MPSVGFSIYAHAIFMREGNGTIRIDDGMLKQLQKSIKYYVISAKKAFTESIIFVGLYSRYNQETNVMFTPCQGY